MDISSRAGLVLYMFSPTLADKSVDHVRFRG
jgi:hypothetical protein